jgi:outer membrane protein
MQTKNLVLFGALLTAGMLSAAHAESLSPWSLRMGMANATFHTATSLAVAGTDVPGAALSMANQSLPLGDVNYALNEQWTARFALSAPPTVDVFAAGSLSAVLPPSMGPLGKAKIAPMVLSATYSFGDFNGFKPYVGAGINYTMVMSTTDAIVTSTKVNSAWGSALELGLDWSIDRHWSLFVDARKVYVKTTGSGIVPALGGLPAQAEVALNPAIVTAGVGYRF